MRITLQSDVSPGTALTVTAPFTYASETLARRLNTGESPSLVLPSLVTYFPCARLPRLSDGTVEPPAEILVPRDSSSPVRFRGSPFHRVFDLYARARLPLDDSENAPSEFVVFGVDQRIPGATLVAPTARRLKDG